MQRGVLPGEELGPSKPSAQGLRHSRLLGLRRQKEGGGIQGEQRPDLGVEGSEVREASATLPLLLLCPPCFVEPVTLLCSLSSGESTY